MRRQSSNLNEDVILFLGECDIISLTPTQQIALVPRTLLLKEEVLLTYLNPISSIRDSRDSRLSRSKQPVPIDRLTNHEHEYRITAAMRSRLLLGRRDDGVQAYFKELRIDRPQDISNIVAVINQGENIMNGFVFRDEGTALDFHEGLTVAIATQMYIQRLPESLSFNPRLVNLLGETLNGRCSIAPEDFTEGKQEEEEIRFVVDFLRGMQGEQTVNFRSQLSELQLRFRMVDETSKDYGVRFLEVFPERVERLMVVGSELTSNMLAQLLTGSPNASQFDRFTRLQELELSRNCLNDDVFATLGKLLKGCRRLQVVNLNENCVNFEKEAMIEGFLSEVTHFQLVLKLASNAIHTARQITKYLLNAEGPLPLSELDISYNPIVPEELAVLTKAYLAKIKQEGFEFRLHLSQLEFQEPQAFEFLQEEYRAHKPNTMAIPMTITKHVMRRKGKDIGNTEEELRRAARIEELFRGYGVEVFRGNFFRLRQVRAELRALGVPQEALDAEIVKYAPQKQIQERMIVRKAQACLNFEVEPARIVPEFNETLRFCRRKGLTGSAFNVMACVKMKLEELIGRQVKEGGLGRAYRQVLLTRRGRFKAFHEQLFSEDYVFHINLPGLLQMTDDQLRKEETNNTREDNLSAFMTLHYLLADPTERPHYFLLEACLKDPRLSSLRIARFQHHNRIQILEKIRVGKDFLPIPPPEERAAFITAYGVETYRFSESFIESGVSSSGYAGLLSRARVQAQQQRQVLAFIEISKNFLKYLYYTPQQLSEQTLIYLSSITAHLANLQTPQEDAFKLVLAEELLIHLATFFDSTRYQPLKPGLLTAVAEFLTRRVALPDELLKRLAAFVLRTEGAEGEGELRLHRSSAAEAWQGKADWKVGELATLGQLVMVRGRVEVKVADAAHPELLVPVEVDELDSVMELWGAVRRSVDKFNEFTNISEANIDFYWLCGARGDQPAGQLRFLASYEHVGRLVFENGFDCFYLRRVLYRPEEHSLEYLSRVRYEQLLAIYEQAKESFRLAATLLLTPEATVEAVMLAIWTDVLLTDQLLLGELRRREEEESQVRYAAERERIVGQRISQLYSHYVPVGFALDEAARNKVIFDAKSRQMSGVPKNFSEAIRTTLLAFISKIGITAFTTAVPSAALPYTLFINNHQIIFEDRTLPEPKNIRLRFRSIIWFELASEGDLPILRFSAMEQAGSEQMGMRHFSIQGDSLWVGQCFALISQVARSRVSYPPDLLFANEDEPTCLSNCPVKGQTASLLSFPILALEKYFSFSLPRRQEAPAIAVLPPKPPAAPAGQPVKQAINSQSQNPQSLRVDPSPSVSVIPGEVQLQKIIKSVNEPVEEQVITSRRSRNKGKEGKRHSRNR